MNKMAKFDLKQLYYNIFPVKISLSEQILLTKHLSMMLKSGISEVESLRILKDQTTKVKFRKILDAIVSDVENGQFLSETLKKYQRTFGELFINLVKLGEISGTLPENLSYLSDEVKKKAELNSKVRAALIYPAVILFATVGVTAGLIIFVLPKLLPVFTSLNVKLPITTQILIGTANILNNYFIFIIIGFVLLVFGINLILRLPVIRYLWHRTIVSLPVVGKISSDYNMANLARTLGLLLKSGVKIVEAVQATSDSVTNLVFKRELQTAVENVKRGEALYKYLERRPQFFPPVLSRMIQIGERTGNLDTNLIYLSQFYENELGEKVKNLSSILEPMLMIFMGLLVGFVAISIITPIYEVSQNIHQ